MRTGGVARARVVVFTHLCGGGLLECGGLVDWHGGGIVVVLGTSAIRVVDVDQFGGGSVLDAGSWVDHCGVYCVLNEWRERKKPNVKLLLSVSVRK